MNKMPKAINADGNLLYEMPNGQIYYIGASTLLGNYKRMFKKMDNYEKFLEDDSL